MYPVLNQSRVLEGFPKRDIVLKEAIAGSQRSARRRAVATQFDFDIWVLSMEGSRSAEPFVHTRFKEMHPAFSPDGRWLAYGSNEGGRGEVYVRPYPGPGKRVTISTNGGKSPAWSGDGRELFYREVSGSGSMMAVKIAVEEGKLGAGIPEPLFEGKFLSTRYTRSYDVTRDGQRFLMIEFYPEESRVRREKYLGKKVSIVQNWFEELRRLAPTDN